MTELLVCLLMVLVCFCLARLHEIQLAHKHSRHNDRLTYFMCYVFVLTGYAWLAFSMFFLVVLIVS